MTKTKLNVNQLSTQSNNDLATDSEVASVIIAHKAEVDPHPQYNNAGGTYIPTSDKGIVNGVATLDQNSKVVSSQLPNYINAFYKYTNLSAFPTVGESDKYYIALDNNTHYCWINNTYALVTFGWRDKEGSVTPRGTGVYAPTSKSFASAYITEYAYGAGDRCELRFHIPHDYVPNTDVFVHVHWSHTGTAIANELQIDIHSTYAKGHQQAPFHSEVITTISVTNLNITNTPKLFHRVDEVQLSSKGGSANLLDTDKIETDGFILATFETIIIPSITGSAYVNEPYIIGMDLHYQSSGMNTKNKSPNFYI